MLFAWRVKRIRLSQAHVRCAKEGGASLAIPGFCKAATLEEIKAHNYVLTSGSYVGAAELGADDVPFEERFSILKEALNKQFASAENLIEIIQTKLDKVVHDD